MDIKKTLKYLLSLALAGVLIYFSFKEIDWKEFIRDASDCNWGYIGLASFAAFMAIIFRSERWRLLVKRFDATIDPLTTFNGVNIGYLANFAFPRIGEFIRCGVVSKRSALRHPQDKENSVTYDKVLGTVVLTRTWDILVVFILIVLLMILRGDRFGAFFKEHLFANMGLNWIWILAALAAVIALIWWMVKRSSGGNGAMAKAAGFFKGIGDGVRSVMQTDKKVLFLVYTVLLWTMYWLMCMAIIWAMPQLQGMNGADALFLCLAGSVAWMIPVPGGLGAYHGVVALAVTSVYALSWNDGMLFATFNHGADVIVMIVFGLASYICELVRK